MTGVPAAGQAVRRVRQPYVEWVSQRLTDRDRCVMEAVARVRLASGDHLEQLCFPGLAPRSRPVVRRRVLDRLVRWRVLYRLPRRVGGIAGGSATTVYALDSAGHALLRQQDTAADQRRVPRRADAPGDRFTTHTLAITELWVQFVDTARTGAFGLDEYLAEPACWQPDGAGGWLKPDAFLTISNSTVSDDWFVEVDLATEHLPTIRRKIGTYLDYWQRGQLGPHGIMPRVLITVPKQQRQEAISGLVTRLGAPATELVSVTTSNNAATFLARVLHA